MIPRRTVGPACAAVVCITLLAHGDGRASTGAPTIALDYAAASTCPEVGEFKAIVVGRLGYDAFREDASDRVLVHIEARDHAFEGRIEWRNVDGKWVGDRTFPSRSDDCGGLARAVAFALALQIQFSALRSTPAGSSVAAPPETGPVGANPDSPAAPSVTTSPSSGPVASSPDESESPPVPPVPTPIPSQQKDVAAVTESAASPDRAPGPAFSLGAGAAVGFGLSSSAVALGRLFGSLAWAHWSLELAAEAGWPTTTRRADGAGFSQQLLLGSVAGCGIIERVSACVLAKGGAVRVVGTDIDAPASPWGAVFQVGLRLAVMQSLGRHVYLGARAEGLLDVVRWSVTLDKIPVWTSPRFAATLGMDIGVRFR